MQKTKSILYFLILISLSHSSCKIQKQSDSKGRDADNAESQSLYFGQTPPSTTPQKFAPGIISNSDRYEFGCTLSKDGREFYFGVDNDGKMEIHRTILQKGEWTDPENIFPNDSCGYNDPMFSNDENRLYFISNRPLQQHDTLKDIDIWYIERLNDDWSDPINLGAPVNNHLDQYYISFNEENTLYFGTKDTTEGAPSYAFDIYKSEIKDGRYSTPQKLPSQINTKRYEADVFIAPDESYMIFCSIRRHGFGIGDLYISFKDASGNWTEAISMGDKINTEHHDLCPYVTKDGQYFFYTSNKDIYWVSTNIFEELKK